MANELADKQASARGRGSDQQCFEHVSRTLRLPTSQRLLVAQLTVKDEEIGAEELTRTPVVMVDLAA
jgi:hypothetical protein